MVNSPMRESHDCRSWSHCWGQGDTKNATEFTWGWGFPSGFGESSWMKTVPCWASCDRWEKNGETQKKTARLKYAATAVILPSQLIIVDVCFLRVISQQVHSFSVESVEESSLCGLDGCFHCCLSAPLPRRCLNQVRQKLDLSVQSSSLAVVSCVPQSCSSLVIFAPSCCYQKVPSWYKKNLQCCSGLLGSFPAIYGNHLIWLVVWNMSCFSIQLGIIIPIDELIFFRGVDLTTNQLGFTWLSTL